MKARSLSVAILLSSPSTTTAWSLFKQPDPSPESTKSTATEATKLILDPTTSTPQTLATTTTKLPLPPIDPTDLHTSTSTSTTTPQTQTNKIKAESFSNGEVVLKSVEIGVGVVSTETTFTTDSINVAYRLTEIPKENPPIYDDEFELLSVSHTPDYDEAPINPDPAINLAEIGHLDQELGGNTAEMAAVTKTLSDTRLHMRSLEGTSPTLYAHCKNDNSKCAFWASIGECSNNPSYMITNCAPACQTCHELLYENRCPFDPDELTPAYTPGDLDMYFKDMISSGKWDHLKPVVLSTDPWVVVFDEFMSFAETDNLIALGKGLGFKRSTDVGKMKFDGTMEKVTSKTRTSENSWCDKTCQDDPLVSKVIQRIEDVTHIPKENSEHMQVLNYQVGQFYRRHHDYIDQDHNFQCGPRVLTFFLYLSDVEEGGGTHFPLLDPPVTVMPRKGKALLWPSVLNEDPRVKDPRTMHEALDVTKGEKFAANAWLHLYDFQGPHARGCTG